MKRALVRRAVAVRKSVLNAPLLSGPYEQSFASTAMTMVCRVYLLLHEARQYLDFPP